MQESEKIILHEIKLYGEVRKKTIDDLVRKNGEKTINELLKKLGPKFEKIMDGKNLSDLYRHTSGLIK